MRLATTVLTMALVASAQAQSNDWYVAGSAVYTNDDGVLDIWDECPKIPPGTQVTSRGCELKNIDKDSDLDGVTTDKDYCPGSRLGEIVNKFGCEE